MEEVGYIMRKERAPMNTHVSRAMRLEALLGHVFRLWQYEEEKTAAVTTCQRCEKLAAIDLGEQPYLFGLAFRGPCRPVAHRRAA